MIVSLSQVLRETPSEVGASHVKTRGKSSLVKKFFKVPGVKTHLSGLRNMKNTSEAGACGNDGEKLGVGNI